MVEELVDYVPYRHFDGVLWWTIQFFSPISSFYSFFGPSWDLGVYLDRGCDLGLPILVSILGKNSQF